MNESASRTRARSLPRRRLLGLTLIGYGVAVMNPYTVIVAQGIAGVPPMSGLWFRLALFVPFMAIGIHHVWSYARRVRADPLQSLMTGVTDAPTLTVTDYPPLTGRRLVIAAITGMALAAMVYGIPRLGWYLTELGAIWLGLAIIAGVVGGLGLDETARRFGAGASELAIVALLVGFARSIALLLEQGQVLHTIVHGLSLPLQQVMPELSAVGMLLMQTVLNFFIPSGSGQASPPCRSWRRSPTSSGSPARSPSSPSSSATASPAEAPTTTTLDILFCI